MSPSRTLQEKLQERKEQQISATLLEQDWVLSQAQYVGNAEIPSWIESRIREVLKATSIPDSRMPDNIPPKVFNEWVEELAQGCTLGDQVIVRTDMKFFPWLKCRIPESGWPSGARSAHGGDLYLVSTQHPVLLSIIEDEYDFLAFVRTPDR